MGIPFLGLSTSNFAAALDDPDQDDDHGEHLQQVSGQQLVGNDNDRLHRQRALVRAMVVADSLKMKYLFSQFEGEGIPLRVAPILLAVGGKRQALQLEECCDDIRWIDRSAKRNDGGEGLRVASVCRKAAIATWTCRYGQS
jgi:hypothetical protein